MGQPHTAPDEVYRRRGAAHMARAVRLGRREVRLANARLILFIAAVAVASAARSEAVGGPLWALLPAGGFVVAVAAHERARRGRRRAEIGGGIYRRGLERLAGGWPGYGACGSGLADADHPYAADLDLFGNGSLFQYLCAASTRTGQERLAGWLLAAAGREDVLARQAAVDELRTEQDLREELAATGEEAGAVVDDRGLREWSRGGRTSPDRVGPPVAALLAAVNLVSLVGWLGPVFGAWTAPRPGPLPFVVSALVSIAFARMHAARVREALGIPDEARVSLRALGRLLRCLERRSFRTPLLVRIGGELGAAGRPPSRRIEALARLLEVEESRDNLLFRPIAALLLLRVQLAFAVERWRAASGRRVEPWLDALGEIEALASLARFAFEHPDDPFPVLESGAPRFEAAGLGHPLLPEDRSVPNDVNLGAAPGVWLVSGSNMSGKSTLLRTVGVNAVLAQCGAPVRARSLRLTPLAVGACMRVQDSLQDGVSHFFAEIRRLRRVVALADGPRPLLFLFDEILHGTHSDDRRAGASALLRHLVDRGALGLVTTHDLALTAIAGELAPRVANVHFEDRLEQGRVRFDYRLRDGVVARSNALALMREIGLPV